MAHAPKGPVPPEQDDFEFCCWLGQPGSYGIIDMEMDFVALFQESLLEAYCHIIHRSRKDKIIGESLDAWKKNTSQEQVDKHVNEVGAAASRFELFYFLRFVKLMSMYPSSWAAFYSDYKAKARDMAPIAERLGILVNKILVDFVRESRPECEVARFPSVLDLSIHEHVESEVAFIYARLHNLWEERIKELSSVSITHLIIQSKFNIVGLIENFLGSKCCSLAAMELDYRSGSELALKEHVESLFGTLYSFCYTSVDKKLWRLGRYVHEGRITFRRDDFECRNWIRTLEGLEPLSHDDFKFCDEFDESEKIVPLKRYDLELYRLFSKPAARDILEMEMDFALLLQKSISKIYDRVILKSRKNDVVQEGVETWVKNVQPEQVGKHIENVMLCVSHYESLCFAHFLYLISVQVNSGAPRNEYYEAKAFDDVEYMAEKFGTSIDEIVLGFVKENEPGHRPQRLTKWTSEMHAQVRAEVDFVMTRLCISWEERMKKPGVSIRRFAEPCIFRVHGLICYFLNNQYTPFMDKLTHFSNEMKPVPMECLESLFSMLHSFCCAEIGKELSRLYDEVNKAVAGHQQGLDDNPSNELVLFVIDKPTPKPFAISRPLEQQEDMDQDRQ